VETVLSRHESPLNPVVGSMTLAVRIDVLTGRIAARFFLLASWVGAALGCASEDAQFEVRLAPDFERQGTSVSILGVFKNGELDADAWEELGPKLSRAFGKSACEVAYEPAFLSSNPRLAGTIDGYTKANGITDDLLEQLGPLAKGDAILTITIVGEVASPADAGSIPAATSPSMPAPRGRGGRGRRGMSPGKQIGRTESERSKLEIAAWVYSVTMHRPVALVSMAYSGHNAGEAVDKFGHELEKDLRGAVCTGWDWSTKEN
jgi:hypothetical protein